MKRGHQTEMTGGSFDCFALVSDVIADPFRQQAERNRARQIIEELNRATVELPIFETVNQNNNAVSR